VEIFNNIIQFKIFIMQHKSKLNLSVILLLLGIGILPTGLFIKGYLGDQVSSNVSAVLLAIEEDATNDIETDYLGLAVSDTIEGIFDDLFTQTEIWALTKGIPQTLLYLKNTTLETLPKYINASRAAIVIRTAINNVVALNSTTITFARDVFFNNFTFQDDFSSAIEGVSEYLTGGTTALNYSEVTINRLLDGYLTYPGLLTDLDLGRGITEWLEFFVNAKANISNYRTLIETTYNCTWSSGQLQNLSTYITTYLYDDIVKSQYTPLSITEFTENTFYGQWTNASMLSSGFNLRYFSENITEDTMGLEAGRPYPTNISLQTAKDLWDPMNNFSFVHDDGAWLWYLAADPTFNLSDVLKLGIQIVYSLNNASMDILLDWLSDEVAVDLVSAILPLPAPIGTGRTILEFAEDLLIEQWANGTHNSEGLALDADGTKGFEIGIPEKSNISLSSGRALFDSSNTSSFIHIDGILKWIDAYEGDTAAQNEIIGTFNLNANQLDIITTWLFATMRYDIVPLLGHSYTGSRIGTHAQAEFYRQWADGKLFTSGMVIGPILGLDPVSGWELGIPTATNINGSVSALLWSEAEDLSLVHYKGISNWFKAMVASDFYNYLAYYYGLTDTQMDAILEWLRNIRADYVVIIIQQAANLPIDHYTLGNNLFFGFMIAGFVITGLGAVGVILLTISKKR
jgi:hypothetical protein